MHRLFRNWFYNDVMIATRRATNIALNQAGTALVAATIFLAGIVMAEESKPQARRIHLPSKPYTYSKVNVPLHATAAAKQFDNTPDHNPITDHGATLGRVLFYDKTISVNATTSCASCHKQELAFTDNKKLSIGFDGQQVPRNSMSLVNVRFYPNGKMFWDERADSLEEQVLMPIENPIEMGHNLEALIEQLQDDPIYPPLFKQAFGTEQTSSERISLALAQFVRSIASFESKFDAGRVQVENVEDDFPNFTDEENYGKEQFFGRARCSECHLEDARRNEKAIRQSAFFYLQSAAVNGVDSKEEDDDPGVGEFTKKDEDIGKFKVPSLRNVELTGPYMHDGRFHTLDQVIEHYNWSVRPHPNIDPRLADFAANGMALPEREKVALTKFLLTLTDHKLVKDSRFSDPFLTMPEKKSVEVSTSGRTVQTETLSVRKKVEKH